MAKNAAFRSTACLRFSGLRAVLSLGYHVVDFTCRVDKRDRINKNKTCAGPFMRAWTRAAADIQFTRGVNLLVGCADLIPVDLYLYLR